MASNLLVEVTDDNFESEVLQSDVPVLVDFWAEWCAPCRMLAPIIDQLAQEYQGKVKVAKMDTDANQQTPSQFQIRAIPTVILFKNGEKVQQFVGVKSKQEFENEINAVLD